jgi:hypothetical protein
VSNYYSYHCEDCDASSEDGSNHGREALVECWSLRYNLRALEKAKLCEFYISSSWPHDCWFASQHADHHVVIVDEYGKERIELER